MTAVTGALDLQEKDVHDPDTTVDWMLCRCVRGEIGKMEVRTLVLE